MSPGHLSIPHPDVFSEVSDEDPLQDQADESDEERHSAFGQENPKGPEKEDFPYDPWADKSTGMDPPQKQATTETAPLNPKDSEQTWTS